ncbi:MAG: DNA polymerase/3'-5' exonuclease PolX [Candidatus Bipolaricaulota bacterium]
MSKDNRVVEILNEVADLLEIKGVDYKPRAYRRAARQIESLADDLSEVHSRDELEDIPSVGENIAEKIAEILETGRLEYHEDLKDEIPIDPVLLKVRNLGPKKMKKLWQELDVTTLEELEEAGENHRIRGIKGFGPKSEEKIMDGLEIVQRSQGKAHISEVLPVAIAIKEELEGTGAFDDLGFAGSLRRRKYQVGDVDILATTGDRKKAMDVFAGLDSADEVLSRGDTKASIRTDDGLRIDLRIVERTSLGAAKQYFTGSQQHNVRMRQRAIARGYKLNEYGLFEKESEDRVSGEAERGIYEELDLKWVPPELREARGEIEAAENDRLPCLVEKDEIKGDLHCHSDRSSDGEIPLEILGKEAHKRGYNYLTVTDHAETAGIVGGLLDEDVTRHLEEVKEVSRELEDVELLAGVEANVQKDGTLDLSNESLERLDIVLAGVHSHFDMGKEKMTRRLARAIDNENVDIIAHPRGRKIGERGSFNLDWSRIFARARETDTALEINASPARTDLDDNMVKRALENGVKLSIGTDSHRINHLDFMEYGVYIARRGWCESGNLLNTLTLSELKDWLRV